MRDGTHLNYCVLFNMEYEKERQEFEYGIVGTSTMGKRLICDIDKCLVTKDKSWHYEDEQRILIPLPEKELREEKDYFVDCFHKYLTGIILGIRCLEGIGEVERIVELLRKDGEGPVKVYQAGYSERMFDVVVPGLDEAAGSPAT